MKSVSLWFCLLLVGNFVISCKALALGATCIPPDDDTNPCTVTNSECDVDVCKCSSGFTKDGDACLISLGLECQTADACVSNSKCDADTTGTKKCSCAEGYAAKDDLCSTILGTDCTQSNGDAVCSLANMECKVGKCACEAGYKGDVTCSKILGTECTTSNEGTVCSLENTECKNEVCACKLGYKGDTICSQIIGSTCSGSAACPGDVNTICKEDKCECNEDSVEKNDVCKLTVSGTDCTSDTACSTIDNAVCDTDTSKCKCEADFTMNVDKCDQKNSAAMGGFGAIVLSLSVLTARLMML